MNRSQRRHMLNRSPHLRGAIKKSSKKMVDDLEKAFKKKWEEQQKGNNGDGNTDSGER